MRYFTYKAIDAAGALHRGSLYAASADEVDGKLGRHGLELIVCRPSFKFLSTRLKSFNSKQLIDFTFHLQQMMDAGVPLLDSLREYRNTSDQQHVRVSVGDLLEQIESGSSLSNACATQSAVFRPMYTSMLRAGEESGRLTEVLSDLLALLKWQDETLSSIRRVLIYPAFVCVVLFVVIGFVMTWLVPGLLSFVTSAGGELPWHTRWLIAVSDFISDYGLGCLFAITLFAIVLAIAHGRSSTSVKFWHTVQLKLPLLGPVLYKIKLARFCRCAALMYSSGINLIDTLKHGESLVDNTVLAGALGQARKQILAGESVADAFRSQSEFPALLSRLIRIGESTGGMDRAFLQTSYFYDRDSREAIQRLEQFIGPILIVFVGAIMSWVVVSVIGPIYDMVFSMQELR